MVPYLVRFEELCGDVVHECEFGFEIGVCGDQGVVSVLPAVVSLD